MRHGLTLGELGVWFRENAEAVMWSIASSTMQGWQPGAAPGFGWPLGERTWIQPKPERP